MPSASARSTPVPVHLGCHRALSHPYFPRGLLADGRRVRLRLERIAVFPAGQTAPIRQSAHRSTPSPLPTPSPPSTAPGLGVYEQIAGLGRRQPSQETLDDTGASSSPGCSPPVTRATYARPDLALSSNLKDSGAEVGPVSGPSSVLDTEMGGGSSFRLGTSALTSHGSLSALANVSYEDMWIRDGIAASGGTAGVADICLLMWTGTRMLAVASACAASCRLAAAASASNPSSEQMRPSLFIRPKIGAGAEAAASSGKNLRYAPP
mmetsp:Transcript_5043/g.16672  ORF Transcript_5043/g.16672 Transcript_5043/m.16672 type:complete len:265 (-) Transcript_5043:515-1309(-)